MASISDPYTTVADFRSASGLNVSRTDAEIRRAVVSSTRHINEKLEMSGTGFWCDAADAETYRIYVPEYTGYGLSPSVIDIQAVVSVSSVKVDMDGDGAFDESAVDVANWRLLPLNAPFGPFPKPYRQLDVTPWGSQGSWAAGTQIKVTGRHGWPGGVPEQIVVGCIELAKLILVVGPRATNRMDDGGDVLFLSRDAQARNIISDLMMTFHPTGGVVVA